MMITEAMTVFWQTLKDIWEELFSLAIVNLVWLFSFLPLLLITVVPIPIVAGLAILLTLVLVPSSMAGVYYVANRVAHGKTFHFSDFIEGVKIYWWRGILWALGNLVFVGLTYTNLIFYPSHFQGTWVILMGGFWLAVGVFWLAMQVYFWPLLIEQEKPRILVAWRNSAYMIFANPFFAFFVVFFTLFLFGLSAALTLPLVFVGMALVAILGNNAVLTLLVKFKIIKEARPKAL
jgi:hypothetical protein